MKNEKLDKLVIDYDRNDVRLPGGKEVYLSPRELSVLISLRDADGRVVSRKDIATWMGTRAEETRVVDQYVSRLRKKLGKYSSMIRTVTTRGYKFVA